MGQTTLPLYVYLIGCAWWSVLLFAEGVFPNPAVKQLMEYLAVPGWFISGTAFLFFAIIYSGLRQREERLTSILLWGEPVIGLALAMTNSLHGWMWHWKPYTGLDSPWLGLNASPLFFLHTIYTGAILLIGSYLLLILASRMYRMHWRITFIPLGVVLLLLGGVLSVVVMWDEGWKGIVVLLMSGAGVALARSLLDNQGMEVMRLGEMELYEGVSDGILLVNAAKQIIRVNPAAERMLEEKGANLMGKEIGGVLPEVTLGEQASLKTREIELSRGGSTQIYDVSVSALHGSHKRLLGWSISLVDVTDIRRAEQAAEASDELYRALFEQASDAILVVDGEEKVADANRLAVDLFGYEGDELLGKLVVELHPRAASKDGDEIGPYRVEAQRKDGAALYIEVSSALLNHGGAFQTIEIIRDATDQVMAQKAEEEGRAIYAELRKIVVEENRSLDVPQVLATVLERMRSILPYDCANIFIIRNRMAVSVLARGYEIYGKEIANRAEDLVFDLESTPTLREVIESKEIVTIFDTARSADWKRGILVEDIRSWIGAPILVSGEVIAIISLASTRAGAFNTRNAQRLRVFAYQASMALENASLFEETHRRVRELELLSGLNRQLAESRDIDSLAVQLYNYTASAFGATDMLLWLGAREDGSPEAFHLVNGEVHGLDASDPSMQLARSVAKGKQSMLFRSQAEMSAFFRSQGWAVNDLVPKACMAVSLTAADNLEGALVVQDFRRPGLFSAENHELLQSVAMPLSVAITNARLYMSTNQRGAELAEASDQAQRALMEAERANQAKTRFLATMSHEIRTPLNGIIGMTSMLLENDLDTDQLAIIEIIRTSAETLSALINDILDLSKIESGRLELEHHPFNLHECMEAALDLQVPRAMERGLDLAYFIEPGTPDSIAGDVARLRQVMVNLLSNGLKFSERGGVFLKAWEEPLPGATGLAADHAQLHFSVSDTGIGISAEKMDGLFQAFNQLDASTTRKYGGTGLGLAISKQLCELMGGTAWAESQGVEGMGTTFHFTIRVDVDRREGQEKEPPAALRGKHILLACSAPFTRSVLVRYTDSWGMMTSAAATSEECMEVLEKESRPDLVVMDDTFDLDPADRGALANFPVLMLATPQGRNLVTSGANKVDRLVYKPVKPAKFKEALNLFFTGKKAQPTLATATQILMDSNMARQYPLRILLAEDNIVNQKVALLMLNKLGYQAEVADNGQDALDMVKERVNNGRGAFDVVLMDVHMPVMNGEEATKRIRSELPVQFQPYIIALTADALDANRERFLADGMDAYISKPIHVEDLMNALVGHQPSVVTVDPPSLRKPGMDQKTVINQETIDRWIKVMGSGPIFAGIIGIYLSDASSLIHDLEMALKEQDWKRLHQAAHTLKSSSANFGATRLAEQLEQIERCAAASREQPDNPEELTAMVNQVRKLYPEVAKHLRKLQNDLILKNQPETPLAAVVEDDWQKNKPKRSNGPGQDTAPLREITDL